MKFEKITIVDVMKKEVPKPFGDKVGNITKYGVKTKEYGDTVLSSLSKQVEYYKAGNEEYVVVTSNGEYKNFKPVTVRDLAKTILEMGTSTAPAQPTATEPAQPATEAPADTIEGFDTW